MFNSKQNIIVITNNQVGIGHIMAPQSYKPYLDVFYGQDNFIRYVEYWWIWQKGYFSFRDKDYIWQAAWGIWSITWIVDQYFWLPSHPDHYKAKPHYFGYHSNSILSTPLERKSMLRKKWLFQLLIYLILIFMCLPKAPSHERCSRLPAQDSAHLDFWHVTCCCVDLHQQQCRPPQE